MQVLQGAEEMHDELLSMRVEAALLGNRLARMDSVLVAEQFADMLLKADQLLAKYPSGLQEPADEAMLEAGSDT